MSVDAPPVDDTAPLDEPAPVEPDAPPPDPPTPTRTRRKRRRTLARLALPAGALELGVFAAVAFMFWWATRSWVLTALLAVAWLALVAAVRALHRARKSSTRSRRLSRERILTVAVAAFVVFGCVCGIRAWSTKAPHVPPRDPPNAYLTVGGAAVSAWQTMYHRDGVVRSVTQPQAFYWVVVVEDSEGCWAQSVVLQSKPLLAGERTPAPCPLPGFTPTAHGDRVDPTKSAPARAALDFADAWLTDGNWGIYSAPGSQIRPLGRTVKATDLAVYPIAVADNAATVWVVGQASDGPLGLQLRLVHDEDRWFVSTVSGSPPVDAADVRPLPTPTTTSTSTSTSTTNTSR